MGLCLLSNQKPESIGAREISVVIDLVDASYLPETIAIPVEAAADDNADAKEGGKRKAENANLDTEPAKRAAPLDKAYSDSHVYSLTSSIVAAVHTMIDEKIAADRKCNENTEKMLQSVIKRLEYDSENNRGTFQAKLAAIERQHRDEMTIVENIKQAVTMMRSKGTNNRIQRYQMIQLACYASGSRTDAMLRRALNLSRRFVERGRAKRIHMNSIAATAVVLKEPKAKAGDDDDEAEEEEGEDSDTDYDDSDESNDEDSDLSDEDDEENDDLGAEVDVLLKDSVECILPGERKRKKSVPKNVFTLVYENEGTTSFYFKTIL